MATTRLLLIRHATTAETRRAAFPATSGARAAASCPGLDRAGRAQAQALARRLPAADHCWSSYAARAAETAMLLGGPPPVAHADLAECDFGDWAGHDPEAIHATDPEALSAWYADPDAAPPGGESLTAVRRRASGVLARAAAAGGTTWAVTHGGLIKAALLEVLGLPAAAVWRLDAAPASVTELHHTAGAWRLTTLNWSPVPSGWQRPQAPMGAARREGAGRVEGAGQPSPARVASSQPSEAGAVDTASGATVRHDSVGTRGPKQRSRGAHG